MRFVEWYNNEHRHSGINYVTPSQRHMGLDQEILRKRKEVYEKAKEKRDKSLVKLKERKIGEGDNHPKKFRNHK